MIADKKHTTTFFHLFGWIMSLMASAIFLIFDVREWVQLSINHWPQTSVILIILILISIIGSVTSLFKKVPGGIIMLVGGVGMITFYALNGGMKEFGQMVVYGLPFVIPGVFFIFIRD